MTCLIKSEPQIRPDIGVPAGLLGISFVTSVRQAPCFQEKNSSCVVHERAHVRMAWTGTLRRSTDRRSSTLLRWAPLMASGGESDSGKQLWASWVLPDEYGHHERAESFSETRSRRCRRDASNLMILTSPYGQVAIMGRLDSAAAAAGGGLIKSYESFAIAPRSARRVDR